jgi:hypothetical protein
MMTLSVATAPNRDNEGTHGADGTYHTTPHASWLGIQLKKEKAND